MSTLSSNNWTLAILSRINLARSAVIVADTELGLPDEELLKSIEPWLARAVPLDP